VLGVLQTVMFAPEDLALVKGDPEQRRRFLDDLLVISAPRYAAVRSDYERVVRQRSALLKSLRGRAGARIFASAARRNGAPVDDGGSGDGGPGNAPRMLEVWDEQLATLGAELLAGRIALTTSLRPLVAKAYQAVSGNGDAAVIGYRQAVPGARTGQDSPEAGEPPADRVTLAGLLRDALTRVRADELERGVCLVGPHRDDLDLRIGELPARGYASHGESWSMALALRLAAYELLRTAGDDDPVLLLDDVFAELDSGRRERLAGLVSAAQQVLVTAAVPEDVPRVLAGTRFDVAGGTVARA
jgi:DNA replication and repair protein RecF